MNTFDFCCGLIIFLIICCGICGNVLSFIVWTKGRRCKKLPGGIYLRALTVSDTIALCIPAMNEAISLVSSVNPKLENDFLCKLEIVGRHFGLMVSSWIIVSFTLDRTVAIFRPATPKKLISTKGTIALMVIIFLVNFVLNLPYGIVHEATQTAVTQSSGPAAEPQMAINLSDRHRNESDSLTTVSFETETIIVGYKKQCLADRSSFFHYANWYHIWFMDVFLIFIIPFTLMTGSNLTVLYFIVTRKHSTMKKLDKKIKAVTMRAVTISVMHCVTSGAFSMSVLIPGFLTRAFSVKYSDEYYISKITLILAILNHSINFLLYSVFGSEFRRDLTDLIRKKPSTVHPDASTHQRNGVSGEDKSAVRDSSQYKIGDESKSAGDETKTGKTSTSAMFA